jgi:digeranylgeranylglycerophospholipid reductase
MDTAQTYDIIVIGAGPAGSTAAQTAAATGRRVCLLERKEKAGSPVRCGEGLGLKGAANNNFTLEPHWILSKVSRVRLIAPNGTVVELQSGADSAIVDRSIMDYDLAMRAVSAGAAYFPKTPVMSIARVQDKLYECKTPSASFYAPCIILADGVESRLARDIGWKTALKPADIDCCAFCRISHETIIDDACIFYVSNEVTPAGYAWVFPRGNKSANIGLGVLGSHSSAGQAKELLLQLIKSKYPDAQVSNMHCGGVPAGRYILPLVKDGVMLAGDAARQVISLTGAGINYSLYAGRLAGTVAAEAFNDTAIDYKKLRRYEKVWVQGLGKQQLRSYALKNLLTQNHNDAFLNKIAVSLSKQKTGNMNILKVFLRTFINNPPAMLKAFLLFK